MTWWGNLGALDHYFFSNGLIRLHCTLSNLWAGPSFNWEILDVMQAEKSTWGPNSQLSLLYFKDCVMIANVWFYFGIFCHLLRLMGMYRVGAPSGYLKSFDLSFLFLFFFSLFYSSFSFLFFFFPFFFVSLSLGGPFSSGAPGHCPPMPLSRYATASVWRLATTSALLYLFHAVLSWAARLAWT